MSLPKSYLNCTSIGLVKERGSKSLYVGSIGRKSVRPIQTLIMFSGDSHPLITFSIVMVVCLCLCMHWYTVAITVHRFYPFEGLRFQIVWWAGPVTRRGTDCESNTERMTSNPTGIKVAWIVFPSLKAKLKSFFYLPSSLPLRFNYPSKWSRFK